MPRNTRGQFVGKDKLSIKLGKQLQNIANRIEANIKPIIRDEFEQTLRSEIYASYTPATNTGKAVQSGDDSDKHEEFRPYQHTGILASSVYATIEGDSIKTKIADVKYPNGRSATEVYDFLKYGTAKESSKKGYSYNNGQEFSAYISQEPHNFEARTRNHMKEYLKKLKRDLKEHPEKYSK